MDFAGETATLGAQFHHPFPNPTFHSGDILTPDLGLDLPWDLNAYNNPWGLYPNVNNTPTFFPACADQFRAPVFDPTPPSMPYIPSSTTGQKRKRATTASTPNKTLTHKRRMTQQSISYSDPGREGSPASVSSSSRPHYAVEKRYRATLNERYATLARVISQMETISICRTVAPDWEMSTKLEVPESGAEKDPGKRQSKTTTLSAAIEAIDLLDRACRRKADELQRMKTRLAGIVRSAPVVEDVKDFSP